MNDFLLILKNQKLVNQIKKKLNNKYNIKNLYKIRIIIRWQITYNLKAKILKINSLIFIQDFFENKKFSNYNLGNMLMKTSSFINI